MLCEQQLEECEIVPINGKIFTLSLSLLTKGEEAENNLLSHLVRAQAQEQQTK